MRPRAWRPPSRVALAAGLVALALAWPHALAAHGIVVDSAPRHQETVAAPRQLVIRFNSRLEKTLCSVTLLGAGGQRLVLAQPAAHASPDTLIYSLPELPPGTYQARWKVLAADGHVTRGVIEFRVAGAAATR
jgi:methionine-rich copper-binding protein CopC